MQLGLDNFQPNNKLEESKMSFVVEILRWEVEGRASPRGTCDRGGGGVAHFFPEGNTNVQKGKKAGALVVCHCVEYSSISLCSVFW